MVFEYEVKIRTQKINECYAWNISQNRLQDVYIDNASILFVIIFLV